MNMKNKDKKGKASVKVADAVRNKKETSGTVPEAVTNQLPTPVDEMEKRISEKADEWAWVLQSTLSGSLWSLPRKADLPKFPILTSLNYGAGIRATAMTDSSKTLPTISCMIWIIPVHMTSEVAV